MPHLRNLTNADSVTAPISLPAHDDKILAVAVSDRWLVTGGADKMARFWNLTVPDFSASPRVFDEPKSHVRFVASSRDGRWLAAGGDRTDVYLWEMQADTHVKSFWRVKFHNQRICGIAFDEVNNRLVISSKDGSTSLWDLASNFTKPSYVLTSMAEDVSALAVSPQGSWVATGSSDGIVGLWNVDNQDISQAIRLLLGHTSQITAIAFNHDNRWLIAGDEDGKAILWNLAAPDPSQDFFELSEHETKITSVAFSTNHRWVVTGSWDNRALLWDLTNLDPTIAWKELSEHGENVSQVAVSPNNRWLITASEDSIVRLWNLAAQDPARQMIELLGHSKPVRSIAVSADSQWLVSGDLAGTVLLWDLTSADPSTVTPINLRGHTNAVVALTIGGNWIASGSWDDTVRLWPLTLNQLRELAW